MRKQNKLNDTFPSWKFCDKNGKTYVNFVDLGREHEAKLQESKNGKYIKYMGDKYYI